MGVKHLHATTRERIMRYLLSFLVALFTVVGALGQTANVIKFSSIAAMKAYTLPANTNIAFVAIVAGSAEVGQTDGSTFTYFPASTTQTNQVSVVAPTVGNGRWIRNQTGIYPQQVLAATPAAMNTYAFQIWRHDTNVFGIGAAAVQGDVYMQSADSRGLQLNSLGNNITTHSQLLGTFIAGNGMTVTNLATLKSNLVFSQTAFITNTAGSLTISPTAGNNVQINTSTTGDFLVNTNQLVVDASTGIVSLSGTITTTGTGINTFGSTQREVLTLTSSNTQDTMFHVINTSTGGHDWQFRTAGSATGTGAVGDLYLFDSTGNRTSFLITGAAGNVGLNQTAFGTSAAAVLAIGSGTAPSTSPADAVQMWSSDIYGVAGAAGLNVRNEGGATIGFGQVYSILAQSTTADAATKTITLASMHYTNTEKPFISLRAISDSSANTLYLGGGTSNGDAATDIRFYTAANNTTTTGTERAAITSDGRIYGTSLHNNAGSVTGTANQYIASGTYTPTLTAVANVAASTSYVCQWMRVGNVVTVSGKVDVDPTTTLTLTQLGVSLPIASLLTLTEQVGGAANSPTVQLSNAAMIGDAANDRAEMDWIPTDVSNKPMFFSFTYLIL